MSEADFVRKVAISSADRAAYRGAVAAGLSAEKNVATAGGSGDS
jgi:hypothetical protein